MDLSQDFLVVFILKKMIFYSIKILNCIAKLGKLHSKHLYLCLNYVEITSNNFYYYCSLCIINELLLFYAILLMIYKVKIMKNVK